MHTQRGHHRRRETCRGRKEKEGASPRECSCDVTSWVQTYTLVNRSEKQAWMDFSNNFWHSNTTKLYTV